MNDQEYTLWLSTSVEQAIFGKHAGCLMSDSRRGTDGPEEVPLENVNRMNREGYHASYIFWDHALYVFYSILKEKQSGLN